MKILGCLVLSTFLAVDRELLEELLRPGTQTG